MKKQTFYTLAIFASILTGCAIVEGSGSNSAEIEQAQQQSVNTIYTSATDSEIFDDLSKVNPNATPDEIEGLMNRKTAYEIILIDFKIYVIDPKTREIILTEDYDTGSELAEAILKDNL